MKKSYLKPILQVVTLQQQGIICAGSREIRSVGGNAGINYGGSGSTSARAPRYRGTDWDDYE